MRDAVAVVHPAAMFIYSSVSSSPLFMESELARRALADSLIALARRIDAYSMPWETWAGTQYLLEALVAPAFGCGRPPILTFEEHKLIMRLLEPHLQKLPLVRRTASVR